MRSFAFHLVREPLLFVFHPDFAIADLVEKWRRNGSGVECCRCDKDASDDDRMGDSGHSEDVDWPHPHRKNHAPHPGQYLH